MLCNMSVLTRHSPTEGAISADKDADTHGILAVNFILLPALFLFFASSDFHLLFSDYITPNRCQSKIRQQNRSMN